MSTRFLGSRVLVCGSSRGIGLACAQMFAEEGADVVLVARDSTALAAAQESLTRAHQQQTHTFLQADFNEPEHLHAVVEEHLQAQGPVHVLVNNTGGPPPGPASQAKGVDYIKAFTQHLLCNQCLLQTVLPGMRELGSGRIINIISTSVKQPIQGLGVSNTVRGAVANWAKTLAAELGPDHITVNNVLPGATRTGRLQAILERKAETQKRSLEEVTTAEKMTIPLRRFAEPEEIAAAVVFLASEAAAYISGINLPVDGGRTSSL